jgi:hypothetical protein
MPTNALTCSLFSGQLSLMVIMPPDQLDHIDAGGSEKQSACGAGEENLDFVESLRNSDIELIVTRHEQTAGAPREIQGFRNEPCDNCTQALPVYAASKAFRGPVTIDINHLNRDT